MISWKILRSISNQTHCRLASAIAKCSKCKSRPVKQQHTLCRFRLRRVPLMVTPVETRNSCRSIQWVSHQRHGLLPSRQKIPPLSLVLIARLSRTFAAGYPTEMTALRLSPDHLVVGKLSFLMVRYATVAQSKWWSTWQSFCSRRQTQIFFRNCRQILFRLVNA